MDTLSTPSVTRIRFRASDVDRNINQNKNDRYSMYVPCTWHRLKYTRDSEQPSLLSGIPSPRRPTLWSRYQGACRPRSKLNISTQSSIRGRHARRLLTACCIFSTRYIAMECTGSQLVLLDPSVADRFYVVRAQSDDLTAFRLCFVQVFGFYNTKYTKYCCLLLLL